MSVGVSARSLGPEERTNDGYFRWLASYFFAHGYEPDDLYQEARIAAWLAPGHERIAARRQVLDVVKIARRKPLLCAEVDVPQDRDVADLVEDRESLRAVRAAVRDDLTETERRALAHVLNGGERRAEKWIDNGVHRARRKLEAVLA